MKIAVVGATGLVGSEMLKVLNERGFGTSGYEIVVAASEKSVGKEIDFAGRKLTVVSVDDAIAQKPDYALFSAGATTSRTYAKRFVEEAGTTVIDNSSAWRKDNDVPLVVPEVNFSAVKDADKLIANPNCSTIQMVLALSQLHLRYTIKRLVISTYQSVTGTGVKAIRQMEGEEQGMENIDMVYPYPIHRNLFPHGGDFQADGYTTEEQKLVDETRKILADDAIAITATVVRVPVMGGHSESINIEFANDYDIADVFETLRNTEGVTVLDDVQNNVYPMPLYAKGKDEVFVGRIRRDASQPKSLNIWVVSDNIRKGAATNAVQIMQHLINR